MLPTLTVLAGVPEIVILLVVGGVGVVPPDASTVMEKEVSTAALIPSPTAIPMLEDLPTFADVGVPESLPVVPLKVAQDGLSLLRTPACDR